MRFPRSIPRLQALSVLVWGPVVLLVLLVAVGCLIPETFQKTVAGLNTSIYAAFGSFYLWFTWLTLLGFVAIGVSPVGRIRLGGDQSQPEHSFFTWFAMLFCAGMGTGFMFWGAAEPLYHFMNPPLAGLPVGESAETLALRYTFFHWGLHPWSIYGMTALAIGFLGFNLKRGAHFSELLLPATSRHKGVVGLKNSIDLLTILAIVFGVAATLGMGVLQLEGGLQSLLAWHASQGLEIGLMVLVTLAYLFSTLKGLERGIKVLSVLNLWLCIALMGAVVGLGDMGHLFESFLKAGGAYLAHLSEMSLGMGTFQDPQWVGNWTVKYWSWWIAWAPFVGLFIAFISKGRTIRELVFGVLIAPTLFSCLWFSVFGQSAITLQASHHGLGTTLQLQDVNGLLFQFLHLLTQAPVLSWLSLALVAINFINSADSATYTLSCLSVRNLEATPHPGIQLTWGLLFACLASVLLFTGGIEILQQITTVTVLPFTLLLSLLFLVTVVELGRWLRLKGS